jgi:hypothetical protein
MRLHLRTKTQVAVNTLASLPIVAEGAIDVTTVGGGVTSGQEVVTTRTCKRVGGSGFGVVPRLQKESDNLALATVVVPSYFLNRIVCPTTPAL